MVFSRPSAASQNAVGNHLEMVLKRENISKTKTTNRSVPDKMRLSDM
jgi:hypothetical protein